MTNSRNRKLIRVTSSNERLEHKCIDIIIIIIIIIIIEFIVRLYSVGVATDIGALHCQ